MVPLAVPFAVLLVGCAVHPPLNAIPMIAYHSERSLGAGIHLMNPDGTGDVRVTLSIEDVSPAISPDGYHLAFASGGTNQQQLYLVHPDGSGRTQITTGPPEDKWTPDWLPNGLKLAFSGGYSPNKHIYTIGTGGTNLLQITPNDYLDTEPAVAPQWQMGVIAYQSWRNYHFQIFTRDFLGGSEKQLTTGAYDNVYPCYTPDGQKIVFTSTRDRNQQIYIMNADGTGQTRLTNNSGNDFKPSVSPDGTEIALASTRNGGWDIYKMNIDGSNVTQLTTAPGKDDEPSWGMIVP